MHDVKVQIDELKKQVLQEFSEAEIEQIAIAGSVDTSLYHFLLARDLDHDKALKMVKKSLQWRQEHHVEKVLHPERLELEKKYAIRQNHVRWEDEGP